MQLTNNSAIDLSYTDSNILFIYYQLLNIKQYRCSYSRETWVIWKTFEITQKCKYLCSYWEYSQIHTKSNIVNVVCDGKMFCSSPSWVDRLPNNVRLICNNITDNRQKSVSACICALLSLPLWHIIKFSPMTPLIMAVLISYVMYYTNTHTL